jgi:hypothetical protein
MLDEPSAAVATAVKIALIAFPASKHLGARGPCLQRADQGRAITRTRNTESFGASPSAERHVCTRGVTGSNATRYPCRLRPRQDSNLRLTV